MREYLLQVTVRNGRFGDRVLCAVAQSDCDGKVRYTATGAGNEPYALPDALSAVLAVTGQLVGMVPGDILRFEQDADAIKRHVEANRNA